MILIDANIFLSYDNTKDTHHQKAVAVLTKIKSGVYGRPFITDYLFNEVVGVTYRKKGKERGVFIGEKLKKSFLIINIDDHLLRNAWILFRTTTLHLNLVDCTNLVAIHLARAKHIATFDREFQKIKEITTVT